MLIFYPLHCKNTQLIPNPSKSIFRPRHVLQKLFLFLSESRFVEAQKVKVNCAKKGFRVCSPLRDYKSDSTTRPSKSLHSRKAKYVIQESNQ